VASRRPSAIAVLRDDKGLDDGGITALVGSVVGDKERWPIIWNDTGLKDVDGKDDDGRVDNGMTAGGTTTGRLRAMRAR